MEQLQELKISCFCPEGIFNVLRKQPKTRQSLVPEQNAIIQGGYNGMNIKDSTLYCTHSPCVLCAKMIVNAGIKKVVMNIEYPDATFKELFSEAGIEFYTLQLGNLSIVQVL